MNLLILDATTKSIEAVLSAAITTTQPDFTSHYADVDPDDASDKFVETSQDGTLNSTTAVTLVSAPATDERRIVREITIYNADTSPVEVTLRLNNSSTYRVIKTFTLSPGSTWSLSEAGTTSGATSVIFNGNKIVNGAMQVAQQGTSETGITASKYPAGGPDLFYLGMNAAGTVTYSQATDTFKNQGFANSLRVEWTVAKATPDAGTLAYIEHRLAGQDLQDFKKGLSGAEQAAIGFWVKSAKTGTYIVELIDDDNTLHVCEAITISAAGTAQFVEIVLPSDTTGELDNDANKSLTLRLWLSAGTTYTSGTLATAWASETDANRAVGQVNLADTIGNYIEITGLGLYVGATVPDWKHKSYSDVLPRVVRCGIWVGNLIGNGLSYHSKTGTTASSFFCGNATFSAAMKASPTITAVTSPSYNNCTLNAFRAEKGGFILEATPTSTTLQYRAFGGVYKADARL